MLYLDTSALAKLVFVERESAALVAFLEDRGVAISALSRTELRRVALRRSPPHMHLCDQLLGTCHQIAVTPELLDRAGKVEPARLRSLDGIHLASAAALADELAAFVAYDERLTEAAARAGLPVASPG